MLFGIYILTTKSNFEHLLRCLEHLLTLIILGFLRVVFAGGSQLHILRRTYLISIQLLQLLNNLFKVC